MINFRYHVVSLTAVFLALAIGLVVGTAALNGPVADTLKEQVDRAEQGEQQLAQTGQQHGEELDAEEDFAERGAPDPAPGKLTRVGCCSVSLPNGRDYTEGVLKMLSSAGATITGQVDLQDKFFDPAQQRRTAGPGRTRRCRRCRPPACRSTATAWRPPARCSPACCWTGPQGVAPVSDADRRAVLAAYNNAGYLTTDSNKVTASAEAVVVVSGQPYVDKDSDKRDESVVKIAEQFDRTGAIVVAGNGSVGGNRGRRGAR